jgi:hypothetical protein
MYLPDQSGADDPRVGSAIERWPAVRRRRRGDIDQSMIDVGQRQAQVTDLARFVGQCFGLVDGTEELSERQRGAKADGDKPRAQGRCAHAVDPAPACIQRSLRYSSAAHNRAELTIGRLSPISPRQAIDQGSGEAVHELKVRIGTGIEGCTEWIEYASVGALVPSNTVGTCVGSNCGSTNTHAASSCNLAKPLSDRSQRGSMVIAPTPPPALWRYSD